MSTSQTLETGNVIGWVTGLPLGGRAQWDATLETVWPQFLTLMAKNPGFRGAMSFLTVETGEVAIIGIWKDMAARLAYEEKNKDEVRALFNVLVEPPPKRHKQVVQKVYWHPGA